MGMTRTRAEHILDAYVRMRMCEGYEDAANALKAVILDEMATEYVGGVVPNGISSKPQLNNPWTITCDGTKDVVPV